LISKIKRIFFITEKGPGKAIVATVRKLVTIAYNTLKNDWVFEDFNQFALAETKSSTTP